MNQWYTLAELHERFGLLPSRALELVREGRLPDRWEEGTFWPPREPVESTVRLFSESQEIGAARMSDRVTRKIVFYKLYVGNYAGSPQWLPFPTARLLEHVNSIPFAQRYVGNPNPMQGWVDDAKGRIRLGRVRRKDIPPTEEDGVIERLQLGLRKGLLETSHFVFYPDNVVAHVYNHYGPRVGGLCLFLHEHAPQWFFDEFPGVIKACHLGVKSQWEKAKKIKVLRKVELGLAPSTSGVHPGAKSMLGSTLFGLLNNYDSQEVTLVLKEVNRSRKRPKSLDPGIVDEVRALMEEEGIEITRANVFGMGPTKAEDTMVNLLEDYVISRKAIIKLDDGTNAVDDSSAYAHADEAYAELYDVIQSAEVLNNTLREGRDDE